MRRLWTPTVSTSTVHSDAYRLGGSRFGLVLPSLSWPFVSRIASVHSRLVMPPLVKAYVPFDPILCPQPTNRT
ncbi:unnamed protein product [Protopolystoma xenopodis]|uniref:Uncharacterized protein n=1 Tax=Protopolystoma xenopodis TaxID=117903 RepID=A0A3S5FFD4_9PLAT|nr:unnamed protein product [Protopolystoma xenopodis]